MKLNIISQVIKGEEYKVNDKGCEEIDIDVPNDITVFSSDKKLRYLGVDKNLFRLSLASYKELKKHLHKINSNNYTIK